MRFLFLLLLLLAGSPLFTHAQTGLTGTLTDARTGEPLPFATLRAEPSGEGTVADVDGVFAFQAPAGTARIVVSFLGYNPKILLPAGFVTGGKIALEPDGKTALEEVEIRPDDSKMRRLMRLALSNRDQHNPELRPEYQCRMYYKMTFDFGNSKGFDSGKLSGMDSFNARQHLIVTETYSRRYHRRPALLNEEIVATRFSGLKNPLFTNLITQILPFHIGSDFVRLNEKDYSNPVAAGFEKRYKCYLAEELLQPGGDTLWVISFKPKGTIDGLRGQLYLHSNGYAVTQMRASAEDTVLGHLTRLDIQYRQDTAAQSWVPDKLNYVLDWNDPQTKRSLFYARGTSRIDSFSFALPAGYKFDKAHSATVLPDAGSQSESFWQPYRRDSFTVRDAETYRFNDSLGAEVGFDKIVNKFAAVSRGFLPLGPVEIDLQRVYSYNRFEGSRWGIGLQTGDSISNKFTLGGWAGYGTKDGRWKWGGAATFSFDRYKEQQLQLRYDNDLRDPGRFVLSEEFNATYLRQYLLQRADAFEAVTLTLRNRMGFWATELEGTVERVTPRYEYRLVQDGVIATNFEAKKATLRLRWAYGENRALSLGRYYGIGTKYPIIYATFSGGEIKSMSPDGASRTTPYAQVLAGIQWEGHLNRWGQDKWLLLGGQTLSDVPLPLSYLFAGSGYRLGNLAFYSFGAFYTLRPYDVYSNRFASIHYRHQFDFKLYKRPLSAPSLALGANFMMGDLAHPERHQNVFFFTPQTGYGEAGIALHDLLKINYLNLAYLSVHAGYYVPLLSVDILKRGAAVVGIGLAL